MLPLSTLLAHVSSLPFTSFLSPAELAKHRNSFYSSSSPLHENRLLLKEDVLHCKQGTEIWGDDTGVGHPQASLGAGGQGGGLCLSLPLEGGVIWEGSRQNPNCTVGSSLICTLFHPFCFDNLTSCQWPSGNGFPARVINSYGTILFSHIIFCLCFSLVQPLVVHAVKVRNARLARPRWL